MAVIALPKLLESGTQSGPSPSDRYSNPRHPFSLSQSGEPLGSPLLAIITRIASFCPAFLACASSASSFAKSISPSRGSRSRQ